MSVLLVGWKALEVQEDSERLPEPTRLRYVLYGSQAARTVSITKEIADNLDTFEP